MRLLLDTQIYLWCVNADNALSKQAKCIISDASEVFVSSVSLWEMAIKIKLGKLEANLTELVKAIESSHFIELPLTAKHAAATLELPHLHRDPFDRIMIAQALSEPLRFITCDKALADYSDLIMTV